MFSAANGVAASVLAVVVIVLFSYVPRWILRQRYRKLPPGPFCFPVFGYLPFFDTNRNYVALENEAKKFGGVYSIYIGSRFAVVIEDFEALKVAYNNEAFQAHPEDAVRISPDTRQTALGTANGTNWKEQRKFFRFIASSSENLRSVTMDQISEVVSSLKHQQKEDVNVDHMVELALNNVAFHLLFGKTFDHSHQIVTFLGKFDKAFFHFLLLSHTKAFMPWLGKIIYALPIKKFRGVFDTMEEMDQLIKNEISEHERTRNVNEPRDIIDKFLNHMDKDGNQEHFNMFSLLGNVKGLLVGASDTTRTTLVWFILLMAEYQDIQGEIQVQIDDVIGKDRKPTLADQSNLPLLEAAIKESMRFKHLINVNMLRKVTKDTTLCGYDIPKGTIVVRNLASHFRNPKLWKNPELFDPSRFLSEDRRKLQVPEFFIPFGYGRRNCLGEKVAVSTLFLFAATLLQHFKIYPPEGGVNLKAKFIFVNSYEHPFVQFKSRI